MKKAGRALEDDRLVKSELTKTLSAVFVNQNGGEPQFVVFIVRTSPLTAPERGCDLPSQ